MLLKNCVIFVVIAEHQSMHGRFDDHLNAGVTALGNMTLESWLRNRTGDNVIFRAKNMR